MHVHVTRRSGARGRRLAGTVVAAAALLAGAGGIGLAVTGAAGAATTSSGSSSSSSTSCPAPTAGQGEIGFSGTLSNVDVKIGSSNSISGMSGTLCGTLNTNTFAYTIPASTFVLGSSTDEFWGFLPFPTTETVNGASTGTLTANSNGTFSTTMQASITAVTDILWGFPCNIGPLTPTFTTGTSGSLTGTALTGSLVTQLQGSLVAANFGVPEIQSSSSCPSIIAGLGNLLSGFPLSAGSSTITASVDLVPVVPSNS